MSRASPIGRLPCPHCGKVVPIHPTECYWHHIPPVGDKINATIRILGKGLDGRYCTGSMEPVQVSLLEELRKQHNEQS